MIVNLIDVDGTLCPSIFNNERLKDDNANCLTPEFLKDLAEVQPYEWAMVTEAWKQAINIIVTGRLPAHETITRTWCSVYCSMNVAGFVSVPWDDSCKTREASYKKYIAQKFSKLRALAIAWNDALEASHIDDRECHVYEDDENVLRSLADADLGLVLHVVDKSGEVHPYP